MAYFRGVLTAEFDHRLQAEYDVVDPASAAARKARALVTNGSRGADGNLIANLPVLELIAVSGVGLDAIDFDAARKRGLAITSTPGVLTDDVADMAIALMLAALRRLPTAERFIRDGAWSRGETFPLTRRVSGRRLGIFGLGRIGYAIARRAEPMMAEILYCNPRPREDVPWRHVPDVESLARAVDILVVAAPANARTARSINRTVLDALGPLGTLVNIARGSLVDEEALALALAEGRLGRAGLDVFVDEPNVPAALLGSDHVVLQPHLGSATVEARTAMGELVLRNLAAHFSGAPLPTSVFADSRDRRR